MKLHGLKKAVGDYQRANAGGVYSPIHGDMMLDTATGEIWTDEQTGNNYRRYDSDTVVCLNNAILDSRIAVTMDSIRELVNSLYGE